MTTSRKAVLIAALLLVAIWFGMSFSRIAEHDQDLTIRLVLCTLFSLLIIVRPKPEASTDTDGHSEHSREISLITDHRSLITSLAGFAGAVLMILGRVLNVNILQWWGLMTLLFSCLSWSLPRRYWRDILLGLFVFYWANPLPSQLFAPLQFTMQRLSITGAEWLLQAGNVRVWADSVSMTIHAAAHTFLVPEACSGMRTAVTVLLCTLGAAFLLRMKWYESILFVFVGLVQVLMLNIVRISTMVYYTPRMHGGWSDGFLHDSTGIFLLVAIVAIQAELSVWRAFRLARKREREKDQAPVLDVPHPFWNHVYHYWLWLPIIAGVVLGTAFLGFKRRPLHRAHMASDVASELSRTDLVTADRASADAVALQPNNINMLTERAQVLLLREKFADAMETLNRIPLPKRREFHTVLRAWSMMGLNREDEAMALIEGLPDSTAQMPGVAMIRAEFAASEDKVSLVNEHIRHARQATVMTRRIRGLYSYLAARHQWRTIVQCHSSQPPYSNPDNALIAIHAQLQVNRLAGMARILKDGLDRWPEERGFLDYLAVMAASRPGSRWEQIFEERLLTQVESLTTDQLTLVMDHAFRMQRPDIGWLCHNRLAELDSKHPALLLAPVEFGDSWFVFRKHYTGLPSSARYDTIDLREFYYKRTEWPTIPHGKTMSGNESSRFRMDSARKCVARLEDHEKAGTLTPLMIEIYPDALALTGRHKDIENKAAELSKLPSTIDTALADSLMRIDINISARSVSDAWRITSEALGRWPDHPELIKRLTAMAALAPAGQLESILADRLEANLNNLDGDQLASYVQAGFDLVRPDLAWLAYGKLQALDPDHPTIHYAPVKHGWRWFVIRNNIAGLPSDAITDETDLRILCGQGIDWPVAALADEFVSGWTAEQSDSYLNRCLAEIEKRRTDGTATIEMQMLQPMALALAGRYDEAHTEHSRIDQEHPERHNEILYKHAVFYSRQGDWHNTYESIVEYEELVTDPRLSLTLLKINALMEMGLGPYAMTVAQDALDIYPDNLAVREAIGAIWAAFGIAEEALFEFEKCGKLGILPAVPALLWNTERYFEAQRMREVAASADLPDALPETQNVILPHAEAALVPRWEPPLQKDEMKILSDSLSAGIKPKMSPFARELLTLRALWYKSGGDESHSNAGSWAEIGRNDLETAVALNELVMLLARQKRYRQADDVAKVALEFVPRSTILWRARIGLSDGNPVVVEAAHQACPIDPEIWLASLVSRAKRGDHEDWVRQEIESVVKEERFSVATIVRAGDFLRREGMIDEAYTAAEYAVENSHGLLPAAVLALRCALMTEDEKRLPRYALQCADSALNPWPFLVLVSELHTDHPSISPHALSIMERLLERNPDDRKLAAKLGSIYLRKGRPREALPVLEGLLSGEIDKASIRTAIMTAEAARQIGNNRKAVSILEAAHARHPTDRIVLNNLVYTLAMDRATLPRARELLPTLLHRWDDSFAVYDTAAMVERRSGNQEAAREYLEKALSMVPDANTEWLQWNASVINIEDYLDTPTADPDSLELEEDQVIPLARELARALSSSRR